MHFAGAAEGVFRAPHGPQGGLPYSVPPGLTGAHVTVRIRLGEDDLHVVTAGRAVIAHHRRAPDGAGQTIRDAGHWRPACPSSTLLTPSST
ncbi:hypothetical protein [Streptomyces yangpuensis]|uniref:Mu transposase domain-containing protein n=1 Tax=Streptomyces yangpuensis TaxID=1648182 RepID=UPI0036683078